MLRLAFPTSYWWCGCAVVEIGAPETSRQIGLQGQRGLLEEGMYVCMHVRTYFCKGFPRRRLLLASSLQLSPLPTPFTLTPQR
jgi:hypothetical protein